MLDMKDNNQLHFGGRNLKMEHFIIPDLEQTNLLLKITIS